MKTKKLQILKERKIEYLRKKHFAKMILYCLLSGVISLFFKWQGILSNQPQIYYYFIIGILLLVLCIIYLSFASSFLNREHLENRYQDELECTFDIKQDFKSGLISYKKREELLKNSIKKRRYYSKLSNQLDDVLYEDKVKNLSTYILSFRWLWKWK